MPTEASFRFSTYLALALACVAVGYAEAPLLPEVAAFAALAVIGLGVLYFLESRVAFLSIPAANRLGMAVGLLYLMWAAYRVKREIDTAEFINMGWHMLFVAMCGPLVMLAVVAKSARSDKHAGDYWGMHGIALAGVGLSAALAEEPICFLIVGLYLCATVWSLALLHLCRARGIVPPIPGGTQPATKAVAVSTDPTGHRTELRPALACAFAALAFAVPFYLLTPRSTASKADFGKPRMEIGYSADQMVDLNRTGALSTNPEPAFEVTAAHRDGTPKTDLNREQRWRGKVLRHYALGEWKTGEQGLPPVDPRPLAVTEWVPPDLGPGQYELRFEVPAKLRASFLADPVMWAGNQPPPLAVLGDGPPRRWLPLSDGSFFWEPDPARPRGEPRTYVQHTAPPARPDAGPAFRFIGSGQTAAARALIANPVARAKEFADAALRELDATKEKDWPRNWRDPRTLLPKPEHHDTVARALAAHLAARRDLRYTTDLARTNKFVDPIEDFLFHSKAGHCERFATALALMLRSQEIPAVVILGFKGCEHTGGGKYIVRQEHAHAWVEALVPVPGTEPQNPEYHWLSLDPTPDGGTEGSRANPGLFSRAKAWASDTFREYLADYTPQQRKETLKRLAARASQPEAIATIAGAFVLLVGAWQALRRKPASARAEVPDAERWFGELSVLLAAHGIRPAPGDTALEFARAATDALRAKPNCAAVAEVPLEWAAAYYAKRFGGEPIFEARRAELDAGLAALRQALKG
jgi:transglutaminase-like putative cysteine protease